MSVEGDTFWVSLTERLIGLLIIAVGGMLLYFTATSAELGPFAALFGALGVILLLVGFFLLLIKPTD